MAVFWTVELDARTGRHRLAVINQQADYLGLIVWDSGRYVYTPGLDPTCPSGMMEVADQKLPERDRALLADEHATLLPSMSTLRPNARWAAIRDVFQADAAHAYDVIVSSWRASAQPLVIELALEMLCRDVWRTGFKYLEGPPAGWLERDPRWLRLAEQLTKAVEVPTLLAPHVHEIVNRDALLARARQHLRMDGGVARYAEITARVTHAESVASVRGWRHALADPTVAPAALARLNEVGLDAQQPRARVLCEDLITALGTHRHEPAIPLLASLWQRGQRELRLRAGLALLALGTARTHELLTAELSEIEPPYARMAIVAELQHDPLDAFSRLAPHVERRGEHFLLEVVNALSSRPSKDA